MGFHWVFGGTGGIARCLKQTRKGIDGFHFQDVPARSFECEASISMVRHGNPSREKHFFPCIRADGDSKKRPATNRQRRVEKSSENHPHPKSPRMRKSGRKFWAKRCACEIFHKFGLRPFRRKK
jgi:hypothetical protein